MAARKPVLRVVKSKAPVYRLRIQLLDVVPSVWRTLLVPGSIKLSKLHAVLLVTMGWQGGHLHEFLFKQGRFGMPDPDYPDDELRDEGGFTLSKALGPFASFTYLYDFGDGWEHMVTVEEILPPDTLLKAPRCVGGENACPPEDVGGPWGYGDFLRIMNNPAHKDHQNMLQWHGARFDPKTFNAEDITLSLSGIKV